MNLKLLALTFCLLQNVNAALAQQGFNRSYAHIGAPAIFLNCVIATDTGYYVAGSSNEYNIGIRQGVNFIALAPNGDELSNTKLLLDTCFFEPYPACGYINDGKILVLANNIPYTERNGLLFATDTFPVLIQYNGLGDTISTWRIRLTELPGTPYNYIGFDMLFLDDGILLLAERWEYAPGVNSSLIDISLLRFDGQYNLLWVRDYGIHPGGNNDEFWPQIVKEPDGYTLLYHRNHWDANNNPVTNIFFKRLDTLGNILSQSQTPYAEDVLARDLIKTFDGGIAYCGYFSDLNGIITQFHQSYICKLDSNRQISWSRKYGLVGSYNQMTSLTEIQDHSIVGSGQMGRYDPLPINGDSVHRSGYLVKLSPVGDSLWMRYYEIIPSNWDFHSVWDMKPCPDGGYILCGDAYDQMDIVTYPQRAWVVKTDSFGCVVPGCQLYDAIHEPPSPAEQIPILVYPNPASSVVNVYLPPFAAQVEGLSYTLTDMQGRRVKEWAADGPGGTTYMVPVGDLAAGVYVLTLWEKGRVVGAKVLVIEH